MKGKIAVTPRSLSQNGHPALDRLSQAGYDVIYPTPGKQPSIDDQNKFLPQCIGYLAGVEPIAAVVLSRCPDLKVISRNGIGIDNIDLKVAAEMGIAVEKAPGANARGVAELAVTMMLSGLRHLPWSDNKLKQEIWARKKGIEVKGRTLGLIGCGHIGQQVAEISSGLGMNSIAYDPFPDETFTPTGSFSYVGLKQILSQSDVISLHCPPGERPIIDSAAIEHMRTGVYLVNTARASLIDEDAVLKAIESGKIRGAATDVYEREPPQLTPFHLHDCVITTPHAGGFTEEITKRATQAAVKNLLRVLGG
jgi:D-3-phosphoglycerate dehydrogenase